MRRTKPVVPRSDIALLFAIYNKTPHLAAEISVNLKRYIGSVCSVTGEEGKIISGMFHPYLERNYFEAFEITTGNFTWIQLIDINAPEDDRTIQNIFTTLKAINRLTIAGIGPNAHHARNLLFSIKKSLFNFHALHPHSNVSRAERQLNKALNACVFLNHTDDYFRIDKSNAEILQIIKDHANIAVSTVIL